MTRLLCTCIYRHVHSIGVQHSCTPNCKHASFACVPTQTLRRYMDRYRQRVLDMWICDHSNTRKWSACYTAVTRQSTSMRLNKVQWATALYRKCCGPIRTVELAEYLQELSMLLSNGAVLWGPLRANSNIMPILTWGQGGHQKKYTATAYHAGVIDAHVSYPDIWLRRFDVLDVDGVDVRGTCCKGCMRKVVCYSLWRECASHLGFEFRLGHQHVAHLHMTLSV
jgi:hypothetical protein